MFNVENNSDVERPIGSLKQGGTTFGTPSPSFTRKGLQQLVDPPPQMIRSTQTDPNEI
jgi:hypothetical protein